MTCYLKRTNDKLKQTTGDSQGKYNFKLTSNCKEFVKQYSDERNMIKYYLLTESEVITWKSQTEALMY